MVRLTIAFLSHQYLFVKPGITAGQMLKTFKKQYLISNVLKLLKVLL